MAVKKAPHKLARTTVDVFRLFKVMDIGAALQRSGDGIVAALGRQVADQASTMLRPYVDEQAKLKEGKR